MPDDRADEAAHALSEGRWTHDFPINAELARTFDLPVSTDLPVEVRRLLALYPQPRGRRPTVEYIATPEDHPLAPQPRRGRPGLGRK
jgi:hypothetical protein